jgi:N-acetylglucosaminyldiphosphoundecaprenol N-acetyl-beta-D-mannosaminyltransferase
LTPKEDRELVERINASGAGIVFIGLGAPRQERFAYEHRDDIKAVQVCVGAAFDYHSGVRKRVPKWFRKRGLEWLFRLVQDPRRLWLRYITTNSLFIWKIVLSVARGKEEIRTSKR